MTLWRSTALFGCAAFVPSSLGSGPNLNLQWALCLGAVVLVLAFIPSRRAPYNGGSVAIVALFAFVAIVGTIGGLIDGAGKPSPTSIGPVLVALALVVAVQSARPQLVHPGTEPRGMPPPHLEWIVWPIVALGVLQTADVDPAWRFTALFYDASYAELLTNMRIGGEPVTAFATHSVAAVAYAVLILACLALLGHPRLTATRRLSIRLAVVGLLFLLFRLLGSTSLVLTLLAIGAIILSTVLRATQSSDALRTRALLTLSVLGVFAAAAGVVLFIREQEATPWGGVAARSSSVGPYTVVPAMGRALVFGSGFFERSGYSYTDSGALETLARFGILGLGLLVLLYVWMAMDIRHVLRGRSFVAERVSLMIAIGMLAIFESGYEVLTSPRMLPLLLAIPQFAGEYAASAADPSPDDPPVDPPQSMTAAPVRPHEGVGTDR